MSAKARTPKPESQAYRIHGTNTTAKTGKRHGKLTPRDRPGDRIAVARYEPKCLACGLDRHVYGRTRGLKCALCDPGSAYPNEARA